MSTDKSPRIGAVHALNASIAPTQSAFERAWPQADVAHLMDGSLYLDRSRGTADEAEIARRIARLIEHSASTGADGILFTGSFFGRAVRAARPLVEVPVLTSFDGIIDSATALDSALWVVSTAIDSASYLAAEVSAAAKDRGTADDIKTHVVDGAMEALVAGDFDRHDQLVTDAIISLGKERGILIAQFSMERVIDSIGEVSEATVLGTATEGARRLRACVSGGAPPPGE